MKILILSYITDPWVLGVTKKHIQKIKNFTSGFKVIHLENPSDTLLKKELLDTHILIPTHIIPPIDFLSNVKWIHLCSAGADKVTPELRNSSITITNSSGVHPIPISEHVLGVMLMFSRQLNKAYKTQLLDKKWNRDMTELFELNGKTVGIIGMGKIGIQIAKLTNALGMKVLAVTKSKHQKEKFVDKLYTHQHLDTVLKKADFVINSLPATPETFQLFNTKKFNKMKPTAYFINIGRGKTVKEDDLINILRKRKIAGAALDVFETEPLSEKSPLWKLDNVILTSHFSGWTPFFMDRVIDIFCANLKQYLAKKPLPNQIDKQKGY